MILRNLAIGVLIVTAASSSLALGQPSAEDAALAVGRKLLRDLKLDPATNDFAAPRMRTNDRRTGEKVFGLNHTYMGIEVHTSLITVKVQNGSARILANHLHRRAITLDPSPIVSREKADHWRGRSPQSMTASRLSSG